MCMLNRRVEWHPSTWEKVDSLITDNSSAFREDFKSWLKDNHHIWAEFASRANEIHKMGACHFSARTIVEAMRWDAVKHGACKKWGIDNNYIPHLARLFSLLNPAKCNLFYVRGIAITCQF